MGFDALIGGNLLSSLNAVISTNERNPIYNSIHGVKPGLYLNLTDDSHPT